MDAHATSRWTISASRVDSIPCPSGPTVHYDSWSWPSKGPGRLFYNNLESPIPNSSTITRSRILQPWSVPPIYSQTWRSFTKTDAGSNWYFGAVNMGLYYYLVCTFLPSKSNIVDTQHSDDEIAHFWQAERRARWSVARVLFMLVSLCIYRAKHAHPLFSRIATSRSSHSPSTSIGASTDHLIIPYAEFGLSNPLF